VLWRGWAGRPGKLPRMLRRPLLAFLALTAVAAAVVGCGSSSSSSSPASTELSYFPSNTPFILSIQTDPNSSAVKDAQSIVGRFPAITFAEAGLISRLQQTGISYQSDIRPLFGEPAMLGDIEPTLSSSSGQNFLAVWVTRSAAKLTALLKKLHFNAVGSHAGATLYQEGSTMFGVAGSTLIVATTAANLTAALDRHAHGGGMSSSAYSRYVGGLPKDAALQVFGSLSGPLSTPKAVNARRVPWVAALQGYGVAISSTPSGVTLQYRIDTSGRSLSTSDLPIAAGTASPSFAGALPITFALNDPAQVFNFAEAASKDSSPGGYARFLARQASVRAKTGVDLTSLAKLLTGTLIVASDTHTTMGRVAVSDPGTAAADLAKLVTQPKAVFSSATSVSKLGAGFYALKERKQTITVGIAGNQLVAGRAPLASLRSFASAPTTPASGAQGSVAFRIGLPQLIRLALKRAPSKVIQTILSSLGDVAGWTSSSPTGLSGSATLALK
jgi:hypothetical protein